MPSIAAAHAIATHHARLAQVGYERVQEIENPELAQERIQELYELKGYPKDWIDKRLRGIAIRQNLTDEWKDRGIESERDYSLLTAEVSKATFGLTPSEHKDLKGLKHIRIVSPLLKKQEMVR